MGHQKRVLTAAIAAALALSAPALSYAQLAGRRSPVLQSVRASASPTVPVTAPTAGGISGTVSDEHGGPLSGVMVSVIGATMAMDITDSQGRFSLDRLPNGEYILAAHRQGFAAARRQVVRVGAGPLPAYRLQLRRIDAVAATSGSLAPPAPPASDTTLNSRPIIAAGFDLPQMDGPDAKGDKDAHPHNEAAWRIRHLPRSILKDSATTVPVEADDEPPNGSMFSRSDRPRRPATGRCAPRWARGICRRGWWPDRSCHDAPAFTLTTSACRTARRNTAAARRCRSRR
jgi:hypothetical protein